MGRLDELLAQERFVECVDQFSEAFAASFGGVLASIPALGELRDELVSYQERIFQALTKALVRYLSDNGSESFASDDSETSLHGIVVALNKLRRLQAALHIVKTDLRDQLGNVIQRHMDRATQFRMPIGLAMAQGEIDDLRLESIFRDVVSFLESASSRYC